MSVNLLLALLFVTLTLSVWTLLRFGLLGYGRYQTEFTARAEDSFEQLFLFFDTRKIFFINLGLLLVLPMAVYLVSGSLFYVALVLIAIFVLPKYLFVMLESRRRRAINAELPDALAQIAAAMRAGATFLIAVETLVEETSGPISQEFSLLLREQRMGLTLAAALDNVAERVQTEEMDLMVTAAQISRELGGNLADIFERLSSTLRRKLEMEGKIVALTSQGKLQGWVVGLLPFFMIAALTVVEPEAMQPIFTSLLGWCFLAVIVVMEILGAITIRKIVNIDV